MKNLVYIISDIDKALAFEWISISLKKKFSLSFIIIGKEKTALSEFLEREEIACFNISDAEYPSWIAKWIKIFRLLGELKPDAAHTHLWRANLLGLTAAWMLRVPKRIFTRHHSTLHYDKYSSGLKWDRMCNGLATDIIAVSKNIEKILVGRDKAKPEKVWVVHHGFNLDYFQQVPSNNVKLLREKYSIWKREKWPVVGAIARYVDWKGIQYIIPAFAKLREEYPKAHLILANASGDYSASIKEQLKRLPAGSFTEIVFEDDLASLYRLFDLYVHAPINATAEAFGQTYVEALASGVPSVFTLSGVATEFIRHGYNALAADYQSSNSIYEGMRDLLKDEELKDTIVENAKGSASAFGLEKMIDKLEIIYNQA